MLFSKHYCQLAYLQELWAQLLWFASAFMEQIIMHNKIDVCVQSKNQYGQERDAINVRKGYFQVKNKFNVFYVLKDLQ